MIKFLVYWFFAMIFTVCIFLAFGRAAKNGDDLNSLANHKDD